MLPIGDQLPGDEHQKSESIAQILSYVRRNFGKVPGIMKTEHVLPVRDKIKGRTAAYTSAELLTTPEKEP